MVELWWNLKKSLSGSDDLMVKYNQIQACVRFAAHSFSALSSETAVLKLEVLIHIKEQLLHCN
jgi:hypothetical protein